MKKIYTLITAVLLFSSTTVTKAQDTILYEGFQFVMTNYLTIGSPSGLTVDPMWYNFDQDGLTDHVVSGGFVRQPQWWQTLAFSDTNLYTAAGFPDTNIVMTSNSWFDPAGLADNWLITKSIQLGVNDTLTWKSAPDQTPRYLDGYDVMLSHTTNDIGSFTDTLFTAAEMTAILGVHDSTFSGYTFSSPGFVHGLDGTYTEYRHDSARLVGILRPFMVRLNAYANQNVFIAFHHNSYDDNLISIDDIMVRGTAPLGINENKLDISLSIFPNPAKDYAQLNFNLPAETPVVVNVYDIAGKLISSENKGSMNQGRHTDNLNTAVLAKGFYTVSIQTNAGRSTSKLIVQ